jgi:hypothetical protein
MSRSLELTYDLRPPKGTKPVTQAMSGIIAIPVTPNESQHKFYNGLQNNVLQAKTQIGEMLTVWRDAVGTLENSKEPNKDQTDEANDDNDETEE